MPASSAPTWWDRLAARDPGRIGLGRGVRALIAGPPLFAIGVGVLHNDTIAVTAVFAAISALVFADFGGSRQDRVEAYAVLGVVGAVLLALGTAVSGSKVASVVVTFVVVVGIRFAGNLGPRFAAAVSPAILGLMLGLLVPAPDSAIPDRIVGWLVAVAVAALTSVSVFARRDDTRVPDVAADSANRLASALRVAVRSADAAVRADSRAAVEATLTAVRSVALVPTRPSGPGAHDVARRQILDRLTRLARVLDGNLNEPAVVKLSDEMQDLGWAAADLLDASAQVLRYPDRVDEIAGPMRALDAARASAYARLEVLAAHADANALVDRVGAGFVARAGAAHAETMASQVAFLAGVAMDDGTIVRGDVDAVARSDRLRTRLARFADAYAKPSSVWFRDAFRAGLALTIAVFVAQEMQLDHAFWVALGTLSVLRGTALATGQDAVRAAWGTGLGVGVSSLVLAVVGLHAGWLWVGMIVFTFLLAYLPIAAGFAWGQAAFTAFVVMLFNIVAPTGWHTGLVRIENVGLGVVVSTTVALLFWPRRVEPLLGRLLARTAARAGGLFERAVECETTDVEFTAERNAVVVEEARTRAALVELLTQRRSQPKSTTPWIERLSVASHTRSAADAVVRLEHLVGAVPIPDPLYAALCAASRDVRVAVAPGLGTGPNPVTEGLETATRAAAEQTIRDPDADRIGIVRGLLVRDWVLAVASQCDTRP